MFSEIEKEYKKGLPELRFRSYYVRLAIPLIIAAYLLSKFMHIQSWISAVIIGVLLIVLVVIYLIRSIRTVSKYQKGMKLRGWLESYNKADEARRIDSLIDSLRKNNLETRDEIKFALDYFEQQIPTPSKPSLLELILSAAVGLTSVIVLAYDEENNIVNFAKFWGILWSTLSVALIVLVPVVIIGLLVKKLIFSRTRIDFILVEDLAFLYINYDKFKTKLQS